MKLRALVKQALDDGIYFNACSFADKLVTMSAGLPEDVLLLARCHVAQGDHRQALDALRKYRLFDADTLLLFDQDGNNPAMNHSATTGSAGAGGLSGEKSHHAGGSQGGHGSSNNNNNNNNGGDGGDAIDHTQYTNGDKSLFMLKADLELLWDPSLKAIAQEYASTDPKVLAKDFADAWSRLIAMDRFQLPPRGACVLL